MSQIPGIQFSGRFGLISTEKVSSQDFQAQARQIANNLNDGKSADTAPVKVVQNGEDVVSFRRNEGVSGAGAQVSQADTLMTEFLTDGKGLTWGDDFTFRR